MNDESMKNHSPSDFKQLKLSSVSVAANIVFVVVIVAGVNGPWRPKVCIPHIFFSYLNLKCICEVTLLKIFSLFVYIGICKKIMPNWSLAGSHGTLLSETSRRSGPVWVRLYAAFVLDLCCICRWLLRVWGLAHATPLFCWVLEVTSKPFLFWSLDRAAAIIATSRPYHLFGIHSLYPCAFRILSLSVLVSVGSQSLGQGCVFFLHI